MNTDRWYTVCHEAGHVVAMMKTGQFPDAARIFCDLSGKAYKQQLVCVHEYMLEHHEEYRWYLALASMAGPVAECMARGMDVWEGTITGSWQDFDDIEALYPDDFDNYEQLQWQSIGILEDNHKAWVLIARLVHDLGFVHGDDLSEIWYRHKQG